jgi:hypothetical protein
MKVAWSGYREGTRLVPKEPQSRRAEEKKKIYWFPWLPSNLFLGGKVRIVELNGTWSE